LDVKGDTSAFVTALRAIEGVNEISGLAGQIVLHCARDLREEVFKAAVKTGVILLSIRMSGNSLEDVFLKLTDGI